MDCGGGTRWGFGGTGCGLVRVVSQDSEVAVDCFIRL